MSHKFLYICETMIKECKKHGNTEHKELKNGRIKCKECQKEYQRKHYQAKKKYYLDKAKVRQDFISNFITRIKRRGKCKCGESRFWVLDFHHKNPKNKKFTLSQASREGYSLSKIKDEIRKCTLICANCHRDLHYRENKL